MAYVVARPKGRFEIRESVHTPKGPRARTLANFEHLTEKVLDTARGRAHRPFDLDDVRSSAARARVAAAARRPRAEGSGGLSGPPRPELRRFAESSRRMAAALEPRPPAVPARDPGETLMELLELVAQVSPFRAPATPEPLRFPPLGRLRAAR